MGVTRIMVVDQDPEQRKRLKGLLQQLQIANVSLCSDGEEALGILEPKRIQMAIIDWDLSPMSGAALMQRIRNTDGFRHIPIVILSATVTSKELKLMREVGLRSIIPKTLQNSEIGLFLKREIDKESSLDPVLIKLRQAAEYTASGFLNEAAEIASQCFSSESHKGACQSLLGEIAFHRGLDQEAEKHLLAATEQNPDLARPLQFLAKIYARNGRVPEALDILTVMVEKSPLNIDSLMALGGAEEEQGRFKSAEQCYRQAEEVDPSNEDVKFGIGMLGLKQNHMELAKEYLQADSQGDMIITSLNNYAIGLAKKENYEEAIAKYDAALEILANPKYQTAIKFNKGLAFKKARKLEEALVLLSECLLSKPEEDNMWNSFIGLIREMKAAQVPFDRSLVDRVFQARERAQ